MVTKQVVRSGLRLGKELNDELRSIANDMNMTKNQLMIWILWEWVQEHAVDG